MSGRHAAVRHTVTEPAGFPVQRGCGELRRLVPSVVSQRCGLRPSPAGSGLTVARRHASRSSRRLPRACCSRALGRVHSRRLPTGVRRPSLGLTALACCWPRLPVLPKRDSPPGVARARSRRLEPGRLAGPGVPRGTAVYLFPASALWWATSLLSICVVPRRMAAGGDWRCHQGSGPWPPRGLDSVERSPRWGVRPVAGALGASDLPLGATTVIRTLSVSSRARLPRPPFARAGGVALGQGCCQAAQLRCSPRRAASPTGPTERRARRRGPG